MKKGLLQEAKREGTSLLQSTSIVDCWVSSVFTSSGQGTDLEIQVNLAVEETTPYKKMIVGFFYRLVDFSVLAHSFVFEAAIAIMAVEPFGFTATSTGLAVAILLSWRSRQRRTLSKSGAAVGFVVGLAIVSTGMRGLILFYFYQLGTWATKYKLQQKMKLDETVEQGAERGATQVLCVSIIALLLSLFHAIYCGPELSIDFSSSKNHSLASHLTCGIMAHHATSLADTLASEMGILAKKSPFLITRPWKRVPPGTNGGVTINGLLWSLVGGFLIGLLYVITDWMGGTLPVHLFAIISFASVCGLLGSLLDSFLGAVAQVTYFDTQMKKVAHTSRGGPATQLICGFSLLTNEQVNLVSTALATLLGGWVLAPIFFS